MKYKMTDARRRLFRINSSTSGDMRSSFNTMVFKGNIFHCHFIWKAQGFLKVTGPWPQKAPLTPSLKTKQKLYSFCGVKIVLIRVGGGGDLGGGAGICEEIKLYPHPY